MRAKFMATLIITPMLISGCAWKPQKCTTTADDAKPDPMDAIRAAPKNHKILYEDDRVRILDVTVAPGEKENMHTHRWPSVVIVDSPAKKNEYTADGKVVLTEKPPPETPLPIVVRMGPTAPHAIENLDTNSLHLFRVELKKLDFKN